MPQLRQNLILKEWVIIATERAKRPEQLKENKDITQNRQPEYDENCPFCPGNEEKFGNTEEFERLGEGKNWRLRVIPNKFPALSPVDGKININTSGYLRSMDGIGNHEVIIESPKHNTTLALLEENEVLDVLKTYKSRIETLLALDYVESVVSFRNHGTRAGASLIHPHSQVIAMPVIPKDLIIRINESIRYHEEHRECLFCRVLKSELDSGERIVAESDHYLVFVPYAAYSPFTMWIFPKRHCSSFCHITPEEMTDLSIILRKSLRKLYFGVNDPDYNYIIRSSPKGYNFSAFFHWYLTIVPRLTRTAGFELGTGMFINPSIPEENAEYLRNIEV